MPLPGLLNTDLLITDYFFLVQRVAWSQLLLAPGFWLLAPYKRSC